VVEALAGRDHVVALARSLAVRLAAESVPHVLYFFGDDPRRLRTDTNSPATLADVGARHHEDVLVFVGDGETLLDPFFRHAARIDQ
jgi:hypothetical protein